ncbi:hypothetical protein B0I35DRAFT_445304 [Stachybotrys elegans]|uniref:Aminoglycoside phosphotransferase domain-containing protein n=1 Tax=Stachybotrys elegans TaxID=80388 RepID=A0A8K0SA53_9HYPO|nr:hypothetical protein B0I35DRAFT_445304 [Stachybotrys elegans]
MLPPIGDSIARIGPQTWILGSSATPKDTIIDWRDGESTFYLRHKNQNDLLSGDPSMDRIHVGGTSAAVWCLGENAFCKVHAWCKGLELEANTLRFVCEKAPEVPVPEVIHSWIDHELNRTFLITKRLTSSQRTRIAHDVAQSCALLATHTSSRFETVSGCAPPDINLPFHFYHADLGPTNIMVSEDGNHVTGIIDWESAAYYPQFWIATKPVYAGAFWLECETDEPKLWGQLLGQALDAFNYRQADTTFRRWSKSIN